MISTVILKRMIAISYALGVIRGIFQEMDVWDTCVSVYCYYIRSIGYSCLSIV